MTCVYKSGSVTPYFYKVWETMLAIDAELRAAHDGVGITQAMIANRMGRQVTQSMRKAIKQLITDGCIKPFRWYTEKGGLSIAYEVLGGVAQQQMELKERPF